jgi:hypothetical protein
MVPEFLVIGAQCQIAWTVQPIGMDALGVGTQRFVPGIAQCLRKNVLNLRGLQISRLFVAARLFKRFENLSRISTSIKRKLDKRRFKLMVVRPTTVEQIGL